MAFSTIRRALGRRISVELPIVGFGGAGIMLGGTNQVDHRSQIGFRLPTDAEAHVTQQSCWEAGCRYWDTSPWYGRGQSEHRVGRFLYDIEPRSDFVISTKVGRRLIRPRNMAVSPENLPPDPAFPAHAGWAVQRLSGWKGLKFDHVHDYSYDGIMRSYEDSMQRLGMNSIDLLVIHDLDLMHFTPEQAAHHRSILTTSGVHALEELKGSGEIKGYGAGVNHVGLMTQFLSIIDLDFFLVSQVYSLLHHHNDPKLRPATDKCDTKIKGGALTELQGVLDRGVGVVAATTFNAGILVGGAKEGAVCNYRPATQDELERVQKLDAVCSQFNVPLPAAAIQFSLAHPAVASLIAGFGAPEEVSQFKQWLNCEIPTDMWESMKNQSLIHPDAPTTSADIQ